MPTKVTMMNHETYPDRIVTIDTGFVRPKMTASHLLIEDNSAALVDVATSVTVDKILTTLSAHNISHSQIEYIFLTHIHLDHAGAAGTLMSLFPNARCVIHDRGVKHMVDPSRLIASATKVFGEDNMKKYYGEILPIDENRIVSVSETTKLSFGSDKLELFNSPGHAAHHYCIWSHNNRAIFTGDTFGLCYPELCSEKPFIFPTTTPIDFAPDDLKSSISKIKNYKPESAYLTHFGRVTDIEDCARDLIYDIDIFVEITQDAKGEAKQIEKELTNYIIKRLKKHGCELSHSYIDEIINYDIEINAQGLGHWYQKHS